MNNTSDNPLLVAPRPVRLTAASHDFMTRSHQPRSFSGSNPLADHFSRLDVTDDDDADERALAASVPADFGGGISDKEFSPRAPSRCSPPSEALEEFLSILKPSFLPPSPSQLFRRPVPSNSVPAVGFPYHFRRGRIELVQQRSDPSDMEEIDRPNSTQMTFYPSSPTTENEDEFGELAPMARYLRNSVLSSPVSRNLTRNPFQRHPSYEITFSSPSSQHSPISTSAPLSPTNVPLPPLTPGELIEVV